MASLESDTLLMFSLGMRARRVELKMSQREVADRAQVSAVTANHVENVKSGVSLASLDKIATALNRPSWPEAAYLGS